jgi:peptidylprolyl isomerase/peptidyl-prolyl cis-trans isomerase B (cyclophilin B)
MAHVGIRDTGGSQFFLTFVRTPHLDAKVDSFGQPRAPHTVFGRVVDGMDVLAKITRVDPMQPNGRQPDKITKATVLRKRDHTYEPETLPEL